MIPLLLSLLHTITLGMMLIALVGCAPEQPHQIITPISIVELEPWQMNIGVLHHKDSSMGPTLQAIFPIGRGKEAEIHAIMVEERHERYTILRATRAWVTVQHVEEVR